VHGHVVSTRIMMVDFELILKWSDWEFKISPTSFLNLQLNLSCYFENIPILKGKFNCLEDAEAAFKRVRDKLK
jgi:hypothetical protein